MFSETPLHSGWTLEADMLPDRLIPFAPAAGFTLPGASALADFAELLGGEAQADEPQTDETPKGAPFDLPGMLPEDVAGRASLSREIDFHRLSGDRALLTIDHLCGRGHIDLGGKTLHRFGSGLPSAEIDLTDALRLGRKQTLSIRFEDAQGAGICGAVLLKTTQIAHFEEISLLPDPARRTLTADVRYRVSRAGEYAVRMACVPDDEDAASPWQESHFHRPSAGEGRLSVTLSMHASRFEPGKPYDAPVLKLSLHALKARDDKHGTLADSKTLMTGFSGPAPRAYIPLTMEECRLAPDTLIERMKTSGAPAFMLPGPACALLYRRCTQEGVALLPYAPDGTALAEYAKSSPCACALASPDAQAFEAPSDAAACWQLCGMPAMPSVPEPGAFDHELLLDAAGKPIQPDAPETAATLKSLHALRLRLRAEAARQGQYAGALCAPGQWQEEEFAAALREAFAPLHLSALPLRGAWWAQSFFSATLYAFIPEDARSGAYTAEAELKDADGRILASFRRDCPASSGPVGFIESRLPQTACVLTLHTRLLRSGAVVESGALPVYVGERGPLEAAF